MRTGSGGGSCHFFQVNGLAKHPSYAGGRRACKPPASAGDVEREQSADGDEGQGAIEQAEDEHGLEFGNAGILAGLGEAAENLGLLLVGGDGGPLDDDVGLGQQVLGSFCSPTGATAGD